MQRPLALFLGALCSIILAAPMAFASGDDNVGGGEPGSEDSPQNFFRDEYAINVDPTSGAFTTSIPIEVPEFHGLEPKLELRYSSSGGNGFAGVGWTLVGPSYIDRVSPGNGAPRYDSSDVYAIDGQEMLACDDIGGDWCTRAQSYQRIERSSTTWTVTSKGGIERKYTKLIEPSPGMTFRWAMTSVTDRRPVGGQPVNVVNYNYVCPDPPDNGCYPSSISYNGVQISFHRQARPDHLAFANGINIWTQQDRLSRIEVQVGESLVRKYTLDYDESQNGSRSLLRRVRYYGTDGESELPDMLLTYEDGVGGQFATPEPFSPGGGAGQMKESEFLTGDYNGDGRTDVFHISHLGNNLVQTWLAEEDGDFIVRATTPSISEEMIREGYWFGGDVTGDGLSDVVHVTGDATARMFVWESDGDGYFSRHELSRPSGYPTLGEGRWLAADFDGDGEAELFHAATGDSELHVWDRTGSGLDFDVTDIVPGYTGIHTGYWLPVDINGDGRLDLVHASWASGQRLRVFLANGQADFFEAHSAITPPSGYPSLQSGRWNAGDFNGDGRSDLLHVSYPTNLKLNIWFGDGGGGFEPTEIARPSGYIYNGWWFPLDMNGDGRTDLAHINTNAAPPKLIRWVSLDAPGDFEQLPPLDGGSGYPLMQYGHWQSGDFNGDGKDDLLHCYENETARIWTASGQVGNRMTSVKNRRGGITTVGYTPSSAWENLEMPVGMLVHAVTSLTRDDGRGNDYTHTYEYEGGKWSKREHCFLGFREVRKFDEDENYDETVTRQSNTCITRPEARYRRAPRSNPESEGEIFTYTSFDYADAQEANPPYHLLETRRSEFECNLQASCREIRVETRYDAGGYANIVRVMEHGDTSKGGDERTTVREYFPNTTDFVVDRVGRELVYSGIVETGTPGGAVGTTQHRYDYQGSHSAPPTLGDLTMTRRFDDSYGLWRATSFAYDNVSDT